MLRLPTTVEKQEYHLTKDLPEVDRLCLQEITKAGSKGLWKKTLKNTTGVAEQQLKKVIKTLLHKGLIKEVKSVVHRSKKIYMRSNIEVRPPFSFRAAFAAGSAGFPSLLTLPLCSSTPLPNSRPGN